jgi:hypothetical protein
VCWNWLESECHTQHQDGKESWIYHLVLSYLRTKSVSNLVLPKAKVTV